MFALLLQQGEDSIVWDPVTAATPSQSGSATAADDGSGLAAGAAPHRTGTDHDSQHRCDALPVGGEYSTGSAEQDYTADQQQLFTTGHAHTATPASEWAGQLCPEHGRPSVAAAAIAAAVAGWPVLTSHMQQQKPSIHQQQKQQQQGVYRYNHQQQQQQFSHVPCPDIASCDAVPNAGLLWTGSKTPDTAAAPLAANPPAYVDAAAAQLQRGVSLNPAKEHDTAADRMLKRDGRAAVVLQQVR